MPRPEVDLTGRTRGRLYIKFPLRREKGHKKYYCLCRCQNLVIVDHSALQSGHTRSCGCLKVDQLTTHRMTNSEEYSVWHGMRNRCEYRKAQSWGIYGGRGIVVCRAWKKFENFFASMGHRPGGKYRTGWPRYTWTESTVTVTTVRGKCSECKRRGWPMNCRWALSADQAANRRRAIQNPWRIRIYRKKNRRSNDNGDNSNLRSYRSSGSNRSRSLV